MAIKTILVDPENNYEIVDSQKMTDDFNKTVPAHERLTVEERDALNQLFLEAGILEEVTIQ